MGEWRERYSVPALIVRVINGLPGSIAVRSTDDSWYACVIGRTRKELPRRREQ